MIEHARDWLPAVNSIAVDAGQAILEVYHGSDFAVETKGDGSPLTRADRQAHEAIERALNRLTPEIPILSEESGADAFANRQCWSTFWMVDPLDGTKEFVKRNGEFTVNIALIDNGRPVLGVVHTPVTGISHYGSANGGAFTLKQGTETPIKVRSVANGTAVMVASRSHAGPAVQAYEAALLEQFDRVETESMGSSLKICLVAEGRADIYPRLGPTSEWDTAAAHCVLEAAGGTVVKVDGSPMAYNKADILNPWFLACGDPAVNWSKFANGIQE